MNIVNGEFPSVRGRNLNRKKIKLPEELKGKMNLLLLAFFQNQQKTIDSWLNFASELEEKFNGLQYYEIPVIYNMNILNQLLLNESMRASIKEKKIREKTITLYLEKSKFLDALKFDDENDTYTILIDKNGKILWKERGMYDSNKGKELIEYIEKYEKNRNN
tara:strand:- start:118 stop:603 length:486 start_codon:yes stop_codon:yes gene_type:complete